MDDVKIPSLPPSHFSFLLLLFQLIIVMLMMERVPNANRLTI